MQKLIVLVLIMLFIGCNLLDRDGDGFLSPEDCNDSDPLINPNAVEICGDGIDNDCTDGDIKCPPCKNGEIFERCNCGEEVYEEGYCCSNQWQSAPCEECQEDLDCSKKYGPWYFCFEGNCNPPPETNLCKNSDGLGLKPYQRGYVEIFDENGESQKYYTESCAWVSSGDANALAETYCSGTADNVTFVTIICPDGDICIKGECIKNRVCSSDIPATLADYPNLVKIRDKVIERCWGEILLFALDNHSLFYDESEASLSDYDLGNLERKEILSLVNGLYLENNNIVPWSIADYSEDEIEALFFQGKELTADENLAKSLDHPAFSSPNCMPKILDLLSEVYKVTPLTLHLIEDCSNQLEAMKKIVLWLSKNILHYTTDVYQPPSYRDGFYVDVPSFEEIFHYRTAGCHRFILMLIAMLRSVNIPAYEIHLEDHGVIYVPTLDVFLHGDSTIMRVYPDADLFIISRSEFLEIVQDYYPATYSYFIRIEDSYSPYDKIAPWRSNDYKMEYKSIMCAFSKQDVMLLENELPLLLPPEHEITFKLSTNCHHSNPGDHYLVTNKIPVKEFDDYLNELR